MDPKTAVQVPSLQSKLQSLKAKLSAGRAKEQKLNTSITENKKKIMGYKNTINKLQTKSRNLTT